VCRQSREIGIRHGLRNENQGYAHPCDHVPHGRPGRGRLVNGRQSIPFSIG
jgi:hypothetical protein